MNKQDLKKVGQARLVMEHINKSKDYNEEKQKRAFLYDLSLLNSMAAKGYMVDRSPLDDMIYSIKEAACNTIANLWPDRCRYDKQDKPHRSVLYVYVGDRQYSFHVDLHISVACRVPKAYYKTINTSFGEMAIGNCLEWDGIRNSWSLSDEEYKEKVKLCHIKKQKDALSIPRTQTKEFKLKLKFYGAIKVAKEGLRMKNLQRKYEARFWEYLEEKLPSQKKKNKCFVNRDYYECEYRYYSLIADMFSEEELAWSHNNFFVSEAYVSYVGKKIGEHLTSDEQDRAYVVERLYNALLKGKKLTSDMLLPYVCR